MNIGEAVSSIEFSDAEKDRIGEALRDPGSLSYQVIAQEVAKIHDPDFWRVHQKAFDIHGFRWGAPPARQLVFRKALESIKNEAGSKVRSIWKFYRSCIVEFVVHDLVELNRLLLDEELVDDQRPLTERIFASIRRVMPLYDVTEEQVRQLYVLWGFERTSALDSILSDDVLPAPIAKRLLSKESKAVTRLLTERIDALEAEIRSDTNDAINAGLDELRRRVEGFGSVVPADLRARLTEITAAVRALEARQTAIVSANPKSPTGQAPTGQEPARPAPDNKTLDLLREQVEALAATVGGHEKRFKELVSKNPTPTTGPGAREHGHDTWESILARVIANSRKTGMGLKHVTAARIVLELIRRSRVICCHERDPWVSTLAACGAEVRWESASPLWVEAQDWHESIAFISDYKASARVLVLMDFDVGIQEAYLLPTLRTWIANIPAQPEHRIILVTSSPSFDGVNPRVLEASLSVASAAEFIGDIERLARGPDDKLAGRWRETAPSRPLAYQETTNSEFEQQVQKVFENLGATISPALAREFINLKHGVQDLIGESGAAAIAGECSLLPWYRRTRGEGAGRVLKETLRSIYGAA